MGRLNQPLYVNSVHHAPSKLARLLANRKVSGRDPVSLVVLSVCFHWC
jgi:hypothetical protein